MGMIALPDEVKSGDEIEVQLAPRGSWPQVVDGREVRQIVDDQAIATLVKNFQDDVLVDADHDSETGKGTEAMAWVKRVFDDPDRGLVGVFCFTDKGADAVTQKRYRFISPAWTLDDDCRPEKLVSVGMTNKPNLPVAPMLNMRAVGEVPGIANGDMTASLPEAEVAAEANEEQTAESAPVEQNEIQNEGVHNMDEQIKEKLGLPAEATPEEVMAAIDALIARCQGADAVNEELGLEPDATNEETVETVKALRNYAGDLETYKNEAEQAKVNAEADQFVAENEDIAQTDEEKAELKDAYLQDPVVAQSCVANARRMAERVIANAKPVVQETAKTVVNAIAAKKPVVANAAVEGLSACTSIEEEQAFIRAHAGQF